MNVRFICPNCQRKLSAPTRMEGRTVNCPNCNSAMIIPTTPCENISASVQVQSTLPPLPLSPPPPVRVLQPLAVAKPITQITRATPLIKPTAREIIVFHNDGRISYEWRSIDDAKAAIKQLRTAKKEYALLKRVLLQDMREIRQAYAFGVRQRGSKFIGGGRIGSFVRIFQTMSRDGARRELANQLSPLEKQRAEIEVRVHSIDEIIIIAERFILTNT